MGKEIERKFLVKSFEYRDLSESTFYKQGYICDIPGKVVRVRIAGTIGYITIKGQHVGIERLEYEYEIPLTDANELLENLCIKPLIEKRRYKVNFNNFIWEVDEFFGLNNNLIIAEIELNHADQQFDIPSWIGEEVTNDSRYHNSNLVKNPYCLW